MFGVQSHSLTEKNSIEIPLNFHCFSEHWNTIGFPVLRSGTSLVLLNAYQRKPVIFQFPVKTHWKYIETPLKLHWKWILMQMSLTSKMSSYFNGKSMKSDTQGNHWKTIDYTLLFKMDYQLNDVIAQCTINGELMYGYFKLDCLPSTPNTVTSVIILMQCLYIK